MKYLQRNNKFRLPHFSPEVDGSWSDAFEKQQHIICCKHLTL